MGDYRIRIGEDGHYLHFDYSRSDELLIESASSRQGNGDVVEIPPPSCVP